MGTLVDRLSDRLSALDCPFASALHPAADQVQQGTYDWANSHGLLTTMELRQSFADRQYGILMARAYPTAPIDILQLIADWNTWLFLLDDKFDIDMLGMHPTAVQTMITNILTTFRGETRGYNDSTMTAIQDLAQRMHMLTDSEWQTQLLAELSRSFQASLWEAHNRATVTVPSIAEYRTQRPYTGAVYCYLHWIEPAYSCVLPMTLREHEVVQQLIRLTNEIIWLANDLISFEREVAAGDVHNLVYLLHYERGLPLATAMEQVIHEHNNALATFQAYCNQLSFRNNGIDEQLRHYVYGLQRWIRANYDWSQTTIRYQQEKAQAIGDNTTSEK
ncbi:MAG: hypothetical protein GFH27_549325n91 [Chloroflexi bacterium AL-W]|nr:hypothetical protein [Chloroflexi bacterium AL-N1]NOK70059.1 hypothetical protein [Chloroflexi bacterium AL-N10]NOK77929.1 hypothetical protein [Chloroflexi bacterium AL-N5]NOK84938.1 hypothetical protein [Chloroflexi bacterium AL-W]NOK91917.1 hypothetical protein [Chloroflexi bacterium AL-N15]